MVPGGVEADWLFVPGIALFAFACYCNGMLSIARKEEDTGVESARTVSEPDQDFRSLLAAATDQNSRESGSSLPEGLMAEELLGPNNSRRPINPQLATPALFVPWQEIAKQLDIPVEHEALTEDLRAMFHTISSIARHCFQPDPPAERSG